MQNVKEGTSDLESVAAISLKVVKFLLEQQFSKSCDLLRESGDVAVTGSMLT